MSIGARGFGSNVSNWLGPPLRKMKMQEGSRVDEDALARARKASATPRPRKPSPPTCRISRRVTPPQVRLQPSPSRSMELPLEVEVRAVSDCKSLGGERAIRFARVEASPVSTNRESERMAFAFRKVSHSRLLNRRAS
jgi:hypothetical protein